MKKHVLVLMGLAFISLPLYAALWSQPAPVVACTEDAKVCPDGTTLARQAPHCTFPACPVPADKPLPKHGITNQTPQFECATDVRYCPDGSAVMRLPTQQCQFAACP